MVYFTVLAQGHKNPDTDFFDDLGESRADFDPPRRLRAVSIWDIPGAISGLQAYYEESETIVQGTQHRGQDDLRRQKCRTVVLEDGEYFCGMRCWTGGLHTYILNGLELRTNKDRIYQFGNFNLPTCLQAEIPAGHIVLSFHGGMGGHLHQLGVHTRQWLDSRVYLYVVPTGQKTCKESVFGRPTSTTVYGEAPLADTDRCCRFSGLRLWYTRSSLCKIETSYQVYGKTQKFVEGTEDGVTSAVVKMNEEELVGLAGRAGNFVNALEVKTTGKNYKSGTYAGFKTSLEVPEGHVVHHIVPGVNGYIQCLKVVTRVRPPLISPLTAHTLFQIQTQVVGTSSPSCIDCDDTAALQGERSLRLHSLSIYHGQGHIYGFRNKFLLQGKHRPGSSYVAEGFNPALSHTKETVRLDPGEFIVALSVKAGEAVEGLVVVTSFNKQYNFGDTTPPLTALKAQPGAVFSAIAGGLGSGETAQLQYFKAYSGWLDPYSNYIPLFGVLESNVEIYRMDVAGNGGFQKDFNDINMINRGDIVRLSLLSFYLEDGIIKGFRARYLRAGVLDPPFNEGLEVDYEAYRYEPVHLLLAPTELILSIGYQYNGKILNYVEIRTNKRPSGMGFGKKEDVQVLEAEEKGKCIAGFGGEVGPQGLTLLYAWTRTMPEVATSY